MNAVRPNSPISTRVRLTVAEVAACRLRPVPFFEFFVRPACEDVKLVVTCAAEDSACVHKARATTCELNAPVRLWMELNLCLCMYLVCDRGGESGDREEGAGIGVVATDGALASSRQECSVAEEGRGALPPAQQEQNDRGDRQHHRESENCMQRRSIAASEVLVVCNPSVSKIFPRGRESCARSRREEEEGAPHLPPCGRSSEPGK